MYRYDPSGDIDVFNTFRYNRKQYFFPLVFDNVYKIGSCFQDIFQNAKIFSIFRNNLGVYNVCQIIFSLFQWDCIFTRDI